MKEFGKELILDIYECNTSKFNRKDIKKYFVELCNLIDMERCKLTWWDYYWWPNWIIRFRGWDQDVKLYGISAVQFIKTSNITIHALPVLRVIYINIFSCKDFDRGEAYRFTQEFFGGNIVNSEVIKRY